MGFFQLIKDSIYNPKFYASVPGSSFGKALGYFTLLTLFAALLTTIVHYPSISQFQYEAPKFVNTAVSYYPNELEVTIKDGQASSNVEEPYFIPLPSDEGQPSTESGNLLVIDTETPYTSTQMREYNTVAWLTKDTLFYLSNERRNEIRALDLTQLGDLTVNKELVRNLTELLNPYYKFITPVLLVGALLLFLMVYNMILFYLLLLALVVWLMSKVFGWGFGYGGAYKVGLYAVTLPFIVDFVLDTVRRWVTIGSIPYLFTILFLVMVYVNLKDSVKRSSAD